MPATRQRAARIPSLDGLRALSISAVLLGHLAGTRGTPRLLTRIVRNPYVDIAHLGVRVFFVISGFLITGLLIDEHARCGRISLPQFYLRRTLRIFPAYFVFLGVIASLGWWGVLHLPAADFIHALTYTVNYVPNRVWVVGHLWSLAVEEQFYLLWPTAVVVIGLRKSWRVALAVVCLAPLVRVGEAMLWPHWQPMIDTTFETTADALAIGCLLALSRGTLTTSKWYSRVVTSHWVAPGVLIAGLTIGLRYRPGLLIGETLVNVAIVFGVDHCVRRPEGSAGRILNAPLMVYVGGLSYSLYLWQQPFLNRYSATTFTSFPLNIALAGACALTSYYVVERPALRARPRVQAWLIGSCNRWRSRIARLRPVRQAAP